MAAIEQPKNIPSPLQVVKDVAFPPLGTTITKKQQKEIIRNNQTHITNPAPQTQGEDYDKSRLNFTLPCKWVTQGINTFKGIFGTCTKGVGECFFAHSLESLRGPSCNYQNNCHFKDTNCRFIHPDETTEDWLKRTKTPIPNLPKTDVQSRKPHNKPLDVLVTKTVRFPQPTPVQPTPVQPTPVKSSPVQPTPTPPTPTPPTPTPPTPQQTPDTTGKKISSDGKYELRGNGRWGYVHVPLNTSQQHVQSDCESQTKVQEDMELAPVLDEVKRVPVVHRPMPGMRPLIPEFEVGNEPSNPMYIDLVNTLLSDPLAYPHLVNLYGWPEPIVELNWSGLTIEESNPYMSMFSKPQEQTEPVDEINLSALSLEESNSYMSMFSKPQEQTESALHFIKVPTKELAEIAIKEAFRSGILNLQIIYEE